MPSEDLSDQLEPKYLVVRIGEKINENYPVEVFDPGADGIVDDVDLVALGQIPVLPELQSALSQVQLDQLGGQLFEVLAEAGMGAFWDGAGPISLRLDIRAPELRGLPWETIRRGAQYPFRDGQAPAVRARIPYPIELKPASVPIKVLVIVGDPEDQTLMYEEEIDAIHEGLGPRTACWHIDVHRGPTSDDLFDKYPKIAPDFVHFIGHGTTDDGGNPALDVQPPLGAAWALTADFLASGLGKKKPRLVLLNACRSGGDPADTPTATRGLVQALLDGGTSAVISTQGNIPSSVAVRFTRRLYQELAQGRPIDAAVAEARNEVRFMGQAKPIDWVLPVLEVRADPSTVLRQPRRVEPDTVIMRHNGFENVLRMVDRVEERRDVNSLMSWSVSPESSDELLFVTGPQKMGKSLLIRSCLVTQAVRGMRVIYVSLEGRGHISPQDFIYEVIKATRAWLGDTVDQLCQQTQLAVRALLQTTDEWAALPDPPMAPVIRWNLTVGPTPAQPSQAPVDDAYKKLQALLISLAATEPLVLVLDQVEMLDGKEAFISGLLLPAISDGLKGIQVIVVTDDPNLQVLGGVHADLLLHASRQIAVSAFNRGDAVHLVREFLTKARPSKVDEIKWSAVRTGMMGWARSRLAGLSPELIPAELWIQAHAQRLGAGLGAEVGVQ